MQNDYCRTDTQSLTNTHLAQQVEPTNDVEGDAGSNPAVSEHEKNRMRKILDAHRNFC